MLLLGWAQLSLAVICAVPCKVSVQSWPYRGQDVLTFGSLFLSPICLCCRLPCQAGVWVNDEAFPQVWSCRGQRWACGSLWQGPAVPAPKAAVCAQPGRPCRRTDSPAISHQRGVGPVPGISPAGEPRPGLPRVLRVRWGHHGRVIERL